MAQDEIQSHLSSEYPDFLDYLPLYYETEEHVEYIKNLIETFNLNYQYEKFESAFFNLHILYMITVYSYILKIKNHNLENFYMSLISLDKNEVKEYQKKFTNQKIKLFDFSEFKEHNVFRFFEPLGLSEQDIKDLRKSVGKRNVYAHPRGRIIIDKSEELDKLIKNNTVALEKIHSKIKPRVNSIFVSFIDENIDEFEDKLIELETLDNGLRNEANDKKQKLMKSDIEKTNDSIKNNFKDAFIRENYLNRRDVADCLSINFDFHSNLSRFAIKKKLFLKFKEIFDEEN